MSDDASQTELPVACRLGPEEGSARLRRWKALADRGRPIARRDGDRLEVRYAAEAGVLHELEALAAAERRCCSFVSWSVTRDGDRAVLHVTADASAPDRVAAIAALFGVR